MEMNIKNKKTWLYIAGAAACVCLLCIVVFSMAGKKTEDGKSETDLLAMADPENKAEAETESKSVLETLDWESLTTEDNSEKILEEYRADKEEMPDLIGWIRIPGTGVDYPVVQKDNEYYMTHDAYGNEEPNGAVFLEQVNSWEKPDNNLMMYGHNRKTRAVFGELMDYKSEDYYKEHKYLEFDTLYEKGKYEIIAVFLSRVYNVTDTDFKYYQFFGSDDPEKFQDYVDNVKALSLYPIEAGAEFGDELITLSTCEYSVENGRMAIVAKKINES